MSTTMRYYVHLEQAKLARQATAMIEHPAKSVTPMDIGDTPGAEWRSELH